MSWFYSRSKPLNFFTDLHLEEGCYYYNYWYHLAPHLMQFTSVKFENSMSFLSELTDVTIETLALKMFETWSPVFCFYPAPRCRIRLRNACHMGMHYLPCLMWSRCLDLQIRETMSHITLPHTHSMSKHKEAYFNTKNMAIYSIKLLLPTY